MLLNTLRMCLTLRTNTECFVEKRKIPLQKNNRFNRIDEEKRKKLELERFYIL